MGGPGHRVRPSGEVAGGAGLGRAGAASRPLCERAPVVFLTKSRASRCRSTPVYTRPPGVNAPRGRIVEVRRLRVQCGLGEDRGGVVTSRSPNRATKERLPCESCSRSSIPAAKGSAASAGRLDAADHGRVHERGSVLRPPTSRPRTGFGRPHIVFDMQDPSDMPPLLEPFFSTFEAERRAHPRDECGRPDGRPSARGRLASLPTPRHSTRTAHDGAGSRFARTAGAGAAASETAS